ncbi:lysoplasmalogenase TMEM86B-like [Lampetra planeri]
MMDGWQWLIACVVSLVVRFGWGFPDDPLVAWRCLLKCLPVLALIPFARQRGGPAGGRCVALGLAASVVGDVCLFYKDTYFLHGVVAFGLAHCCYIKAFGLRGDHLVLGLVLLSCALAAFAFLYPGVSDDAVLAPAILAYSLLIFTMAWRALARLFGGPGWGACELSGALGAALFVASDLTLATNRFRFAVPHAALVTHATYYAAQQLIALSVKRESLTGKQWKLP